MSSNEVPENTDLEKTLHHLLTANTEQDVETQTERKTHIEIADFPTKYNNDEDGYSELDNENLQCADVDIFDSDIIQGKHLTLESILESDDGMMFDLDDNSKKRPSSEASADYEQTVNHKKGKFDPTMYEQLLSPASLSPLSTDDNKNINSSILSKTNDTKSPSITIEPHTNDFTIEQVKEMKKRIINTHKLMLNFNFLKDSYSKTCVEFKKVLNILKDSEIHRSHLLKENEELRLKLNTLTK